MCHIGEGPVRVLALLGCILGLVEGRQAAAADVVPPAWRGEAGTTYQQWSFSTPANPASPGISANPFGTPSAAITVGMYGSGWLQQLPGMGTPSGYWDLGSGNGQIAATIPNHSGVLPYKDVWVQVTYFRDISAPPVVSVVGATLLGSQTVLVEHVSTGGDWYVDQTRWRIEPSSSPDIPLVKTAPQWGSVVDELVVDTRYSTVPAYCNLPSVDVDGSGRVDHDDMMVFQACSAGPAVPHSADDPRCACFDTDADADVDQDDFGVFQRCYSGPLRPADANCAE